MERISAFPEIVESRDGEGRLSITHNQGMTLRDYFAAKAMNKYLSWESHVSLETIAIRSYKVADAMLEARKK